MTIVEIPVEQNCVRNISSIHPGQNVVNAHIVIFKLADWPQSLSQHIDANVRTPIDHKKNVKLIKKSAIEEPFLFGMKHGGIHVRASGFTTTDHVCTITLNDGDGIINGGHSARAFTQLVSENDPEDEWGSARCMMIVFTNPDNSLTEEQWSTISSAQNTHMAVKDISLLEKQGKFQWIKDALSGTEFENLIAYNENALLGEERIVVSDVIKMCLCLDMIDYQGEHHPMVYRAPTPTLLDKVTKNDIYEHRYGVIVADAIRLFKFIKENSQDIRVNDSYDQLYVSGTDHLSDPITWVILAGFRSCVSITNNQLVWNKPFNAIKEHWLEKDQAVLTSLAAAGSTRREVQDAVKVQRPLWALAEALI